MNERIPNYTEWTPCRFQISDRDGAIKFRDGIVKSGLGIFTDSFVEKGETIVDYILTHIRSGHNVVDRLHPFVSEEMAKEFADDLWNAGANFRVGEQGVKAQAKILVPLIEMYRLQCELAWKGQLPPEGSIMFTVSENPPDKN